MSRQAAVDVNTEASQSEQIVWDDPTAREERAKLADNLQWPGSPSQHSEPLAILPPPPPPHTDQSARDTMTDSELVEMGEGERKDMHVCMRTSVFCFCLWGPSGKILKHNAR